MGVQDVSTSIPLAMSKKVSKSKSKSAVKSKAKPAAKKKSVKVSKASKLGEVGSSLLKDLAHWEAPEATPASIGQKCKPNHSRQGTPGVISQECRRNNLEQIADRER